MSFFSKKILSLILILSSTASLTAQDYIYFRDGGKAKVRIIERTKTEVVYQLWAKRNGPIFRVSDHLVKKIVTRDGESFDLNPLSLVQDHKSSRTHWRNRLMIDLISPALGHISLSYEHWLQEGLSLEISLGYIGLSTDIHAGPPYENSHQDMYLNEQGQWIPFTETYTSDRKNKGGGYFRIGPKFPLHQVRGNQLFYFQPEGLISYLEMEGYSSHFTDPPDAPVVNFPHDYSYQQQIMQAGIFLHTGYQLQVKRLILDGKFGFGYSIRQSETDIENHFDQPLPYYLSNRTFFHPEYQYSHLFVEPRSHNLAISFALRVGIAL